MNKIVLWENGDWQWLELVGVKLENSSMKHITLTLGENWTDFEVSRMVSDYYEESLDWIFSEENKESE